MNVSGTPNPVPAASQLNAPTAIDKRAQLQALMLKKALESQQQQADAMSREAEGKGQIVDLRI